MRLALRVLVGVFAVIGAAYVAFALYASLFLPNCTFTQTPSTNSPDGRYFAVIEGSLCEDAHKSWSRVVLGKRGGKERFVVAEERDTNTLALSIIWGGPMELVVYYSPGASVKQLGTDGGDWPRVTLRRSDK